MPFHGPPHAHGKARATKRKADRRAKQLSTGDSVWTQCKGKAHTWAHMPPDASARAKQITPVPSTKASPPRWPKPTRVVYVNGERRECEDQIGAPSVEAPADTVRRLVRLSGYTSDPITKVRK